MYFRAERYHAMTGSLGESLRQAITVDDEGSTTCIFALIGLALKCVIYSGVN